MAEETKNTLADETVEKAVGTASEEVVEEKTDDKENPASEEEMQEAVRILAGFCDEKSGASHTDVAVNRLEDSAHGNRGVHVSGEKNV